MSERTFSREGDLAMSLMHRIMGRHFPMCDVDSVWFDGFQPVAIADWKDWRRTWTLTGRGSASLKAQRNLAAGFRSERCPDGLPFFVIMYQPGIAPEVTQPLTQAASDLEVEGLVYQAGWRAYGLNAPAAKVLEATGFVEGDYLGCPYRTLGYRGFVHLEAHVRMLDVAKMLQGFGATGLSSGTPEGFFMENLQGAPSTWRGFDDGHVPRAEITPPTGRTIVVADDAATRSDVNAIRAADGLPPLPPA